MKLTAPRNIKERMTALLRILGAVGAFGLCTIASSTAATTTSTAGIAATIANTCTINSVVNPSTPTLTGGVAPSEVAGGFNFTCTSGAAVTIALSVGLNGSGAGTASPTRAVKNGTNTLAYNIYQASGATTLWGDDAGVNTKGASGIGSPQATNFYVDFATPALTLPAGSYTDTVTITFSY